MPAARPMRRRSSTRDKEHHKVDDSKNTDVDKVFRIQFFLVHCRDSFLLCKAVRLDFPTDSFFSHANKIRINACLFDKLIMRTLLRDFTMVDNNDLIRILYGF